MGHFDVVVRKINQKYYLIPMDLYTVRRKMTSEIVVMNKLSVAIAADSAATVTGEKIFNANKIFTLSKYHPVGIMFYGNTQFMGVPWETIIKNFRNDLGNTGYDSLNEYISKFFDYISNNGSLFSEDNIFHIFNGTLWGVLNDIKENIRRKVDDTIRQKGNISEREITEITDQVMSYYIDSWKSVLYSEPINSLDGEYLTKKYDDEINTAIKGTFENLDISRYTNDLKSMVVKIYLMGALYKDLYSGLVFVGFGKNEIFPSYQEFYIYGYINNTLKYKGAKYDSISFENSATMSSFAQGDVIETFMEGISPNLNRLFIHLIPSLFTEYTDKVVGLVNLDGNELDILKRKLTEISKIIIEKYFYEIQDFKKHTHVDPVMDIVSHLPKEELAELAESLVHLTSLKRRVSNDAESVGGPIDVAVISKGDGFIWMKRKQYFDIQLNSHFETNYYNKR
ncbi:hypothetical protein E2N92_01735 [Methanofollis formosanus]|uniref:Uncharacterized protein n=1 Tax=Methanofollis formosanus TaxID=299308 RepID=A0A8G1EEM9_9EURY|nr:hypothetical protein [Methanofollis formosanus]QYZ78238.1 hypothetical protein E2N92_01735 [Methanofollis formosanus]